jgi:hypothetical protein
MIMYPKIRNYRECNYKPETKETKTSLEHMHVTYTVKGKNRLLLCLSSMSAPYQVYTGKA